MISSKVIAAALALGAASVMASSRVLSTEPAAVAVPRAPTPPQSSVYKDRWLSLTMPANPTETQLRALARAIAHDAALPSEFSVVEEQGRTELVATGIRNVSQHTWQCIATVTEDVGDVIEARLFLDGVLKRTAMYSNGLIEDSGDMSVATMPIMLPEQGSHTVRVEWDGSDAGVTSSRSFSY